MEQTKCYVKLYINRADEYQSRTSLNHPVFCVPRNFHPRLLHLCPGDAADFEVVWSDASPAPGRFPIKT
jgi:hypothetical protein